MAMSAAPIIHAGLFDACNDAAPDCLLADISAHEKARYRALSRHPERARQYLGSRWLLRAHLGFELGLAPVDVPIQHHDDGPPTLAGHACRLSLSHSGAHCLCLSSNHALPVGCDIEHNRPNRRVQAIARQYFHPLEAQQLAVLDDAHAHQAFLRLWTLKEATQKARGVGLVGGLRSPAFELRPTLRCIDAPAARHHWTFVVHATAQYSLALAVAAPDAPVPLRLFHYTATPQGPLRRSMTACLQCVHTAA